MEKTGIYDKLQGKMFSSEINNAVKLHLKERGYFVDNLWHLNDVSDRFECTDDQAYKVLSKVLESDYIMMSIHEAICQVAQDEFNLKFKNDV
tara:strand:- start:371 stop:646 length:276 start_codon:yes stop_codon:yes gene_type:complete